MPKLFCDYIKYMLIIVLVLIIILLIGLIILEC